MTYLAPALTPLDLTVANALCCRIVVSTGDNSRTIGPLVCPFPVETRPLCVVVQPSATTLDAAVCIYST